MAESLPSRGRLLRWVVALLLVGHGIIHVLGPLEVWGVAHIAELSGRPVIDLGATATDVLAAVWLIPLGVFIAAGVGVLARRAWWRMLAVAGVVVSQMVIVLWWDDAATGTIPNLLVAAAVISAGRLGLARHPG